MTTKSYQNEYLRQKLFNMRRTKKKNPKMYLNPEQIELIESWGFYVEPYIYRVTTKAIPDVKNQPAILKQIHFTRVYDRKSYINCTLTCRERKLLELYNVKISVLKYEVVLNPM